MKRPFRIKNAAREDLEIFGVMLGVVCEFSGFTPEQIFGRCVKANVARVRQTLAYLLRTITGASTHAIGDFLRRDHGTVLHSEHTIRGYIEVYPEVKREIGELSRLCLDALAARRDSARAERRALPEENLLGAIHKNESRN